MEILSFAFGFVCGIIVSAGVIVAIAAKLSEHLRFPF